MKRRKSVKENVDYCVDPQDWLNHFLSCHPLRYDVRIALHKESDETLQRKFKEITKLRIDTLYPFLLAVYADFENDMITNDEL